MATTTDYDAPRGTVADLAEDSLDELKARRTTTQALVDLDEVDPDGFELPGADLADEELTVAVVPMRADEFRCSRCFLVHHRSQRVQFTVPYLNIGQMALIRRVDYERLRAPDAMEQPTARIGFLSGTTAEADGDVPLHQQA
jgi:hypothetical protein